MLAGYGAPPQNNNNPVDYGYAQNMTLGGLEQVSHQPNYLVSAVTVSPQLRAWRVAQAAARRNGRSAAAAASSDTSGAAAASSDTSASITGGAGGGGLQAGQGAGRGGHPSGLSMMTNHGNVCFANCAVFVLRTIMVSKDLDSILLPLLHYDPFLLCTIN